MVKYKQLLLVAAGIKITLRAPDGDNAVTGELCAAFSEACFPDGASLVAPGCYSSIRETGVGSGVRARGIAELINIG